MSYEQWLRKVDAILIGMCGMGHEDLPDRGWRDEFDDGSRPSTAVNNICGDSIEDMMDNFA